MEHTSPRQIPVHIMSLANKYHCISVPAGFWSSLWPRPAKGQPVEWTKGHHWVLPPPLGSTSASELTSLCSASTGTPRTMWTPLLSDLVCKAKQRCLEWDHACVHMFDSVHYVHCGTVRFCTLCSLWQCEILYIMFTVAMWDSVHYVHCGTVIIKAELNRTAEDKRRWC